MLSPRMPISIMQAPAIRAPQLWLSATTRPQPLLCNKCIVQGVNYVFIYCICHGTNRNCVLGISEILRHCKRSEISSSILYIAGKNCLWVWMLLLSFLPWAGKCCKRRKQLVKWSGATLGNAEQYAKFQRPNLLFINCPNQLVSSSA